MAKMSHKDFVTEVQRKLKSGEKVSAESKARYSKIKDMYSEQARKIKTSRNSEETVGRNRYGGNLSAKQGMKKLALKGYVKEQTTGPTVKKLETALLRLKKQQESKGKKK